MTYWQRTVFIVHFGRFREIPALWASALTAAMFSAWFFPGWAVMLGSSHAGYARFHYFLPTLGLTLVSVGCSVLLSRPCIRVLQLESGVKKADQLLFPLGFCLSFLGIVTASLKGAGAAFFCLGIVIVSLIRVCNQRRKILDAFLGSLAVILIYMTIIFKYRFPTVEALGHQDCRETGMWIFLLSIFCYQFACLAIPDLGRRMKIATLLLLAQPVVVIPLLVSLQWRWHSAFTIPMTIFLIWIVVVAGRLLMRENATTSLLQIGRPLVDFLLMGSVGFALFFDWNGEVTIFNSNTMRTLLLMCPGYFIAGFLLAWFQPKTVPNPSRRSV